MAGNVNINVSSSGFCQACGAANPAQATYCLACREPLSTVTGGTDTSTTPLTGLLLPEVIIQQRYRILDVLSTGTVSTVYKAEDIQLGDRVVNTNIRYTLSHGRPIVSASLQVMLVSRMVKEVQYLSGL